MSDPRPQGVAPEAVVLPNQVRQRARPIGVPFEISDFENVETFLNAILLKRHLEPAFEDLHRIDLLLHNPNIPEERFAWPIQLCQIELSVGRIHGIAYESDTPGACPTR